MLYSQRSFRNARLASCPPKSQRLPVEGSVQVIAPHRAGTLVTPLVAGILMGFQTLPQLPSYLSVCVYSHNSLKNCGWVLGGGVVLVKLIPVKSHRLPFK